MQFATQAIFNKCILKHMQLETRSICNTGNLQHMTCNLQHVQVATRAICNMCNLQHLQFDLQHMQFVTHAIQNMQYWKLIFNQSSHPPIPNHLPPAPPGKFILGRVNS